MLVLDESMHSMVYSIYNMEKPQEGYNNRLLVNPLCQVS